MPYAFNPQASPYLQMPPTLNGWGQPAMPAMPARPAPAPPFAPGEHPLLGGIRQLAAAVTQELAQLFGVRLDRNEETAWLTFQTTPAVIGAGAVANRQIMQVGQEADFVAVGACVFVSNGATPPIVQPNALRFQIIDGSTNRQFMRATIPISFLSETLGGASAGSRPWFLPKPRIFSRNSNVIWLFDNVNAAQVSVDVAFFGYRIYDQDALDLTKAR